MKLLLRLESGTLEGKTFELTEGFLTVGRSENCSVRFDPYTEKIASKQHAFIESRPDGYYLIDNQSTNGTFLNERQIQTEKLSSGDIIRFGKGGVTGRVSIEEESSNELASEPTVFKPQMDYQQFQPPLNQIQPEQPVQWRNSFSNLGLVQQEMKPPPRPIEKYIGIGVTILSFLILAPLVMLIMFGSIGFTTAIFATFVAFTPALFYFLPLIWIDRYDPEPFWLLALAFSWGALVSVFVSIIINSLIGAVALQSTRDPIAAEAITAVFSAPIFEECSKGLGLLLLLVFFRKYFDDILDGIVYAGVIALGFATVENILYYGEAINKGGAGGLMFLFILRGILSPFAHVTFTAMTGIGCGIARESHNIFVRILLPLMGLGCAIFLHFVWNLLATFLEVRGVFQGSWYYAYIFLQVPFFLLFVSFTLYVMHRQNKILREMLAIDVARGLIPQEHYDKATSAFKSTGWLLGSLFSGKFLARKNYLRAIGKLGLSYWHIQRATAAQGQTGSFQQNPILRDEVLRWRDKV